MVIYLEKGFIEKLAELDLTDFIIQDFVRELFRKSREYHLRVDYEEDQFRSLLLSGNVFIRDISENCNTIGYGFRWGDVLSHAHFSKHRLFLLSKPANKHKITEAGYEFLSPDGIKDKWQVYTPSRDDNVIITSLNANKYLPEDRFSAWGDLQRWEHPLNGIVLYDKYILTNNSGQQIKYNLIPLLKQLNKMANGLTDITIIALKAQVDVDNSGQTGIYKIRNLFNQIQRNIPKCKLQFILFDHKSFSGSPHDRFIITNYFLIDRGAGFNIFGSVEKIWDPSPLAFRFLFARRNLAQFKELKAALVRLIRRSLINNSGVFVYPQRPKAHAVNGLLRHCINN